MPVIEVTTLADARLAPYVGVSDPVMLRSGGRFIAEGREVVKRLLASGVWRTESVLVSPAALEHLSAALAPHLPGTDVFVAPPDIINRLTGFNIHRGCLAVGVRGEACLPGAVVPAGNQAAAIVVLDGVANPDNVGGLFRNALAFGAAAVLLSPTSCDPLYRKAIRTSMGASLVVPFARLTGWPESLHLLKDAGFAVVALTTDVDALDLESALERWGRRCAIVVGNEGAGVSESVLARADGRARIAMAPGVDSLNAATAGAVALYVRRSRYNP